MSSLTDYFAKSAYKPKYYIGDRVFGYYGKTPFIGTVGNDRLVSLINGPEITVQLDLPILTENGFRSIIVVKHKQIRQILKDYDAEDTAGLRRRTARS